MTQLAFGTTKRSSRWSARPTLGSLTACALGGSLLLGLADPAAAAGSFAGFAGYWRGAGTITLKNGSQERIRCKGTYAVRSDNEAANLNLVCASDSYKINITSAVTANGNGFSGQWQEATRQVQGQVTGNFPGPGQLEANLEGLGFSMQFSARVKGKRQAVTVRTQGSDVQSASITMTR